MYSNRSHIYGSLLRNAGCAVTSCLESEWSDAGVRVRCGSLGMARLHVATTTAIINIVVVLSV